MAVYRVSAEVRRDCSASPWMLGGFVFAEEWHPAGAGIERPSGRAICGRNVRLVELPPFIAPDDASALAVALEEAGRVGSHALAARGAAPGVFRIEMPAWIAGGELPDGGG